MCARDAPWTFQDFVSMKSVISKFSTSACQNESERAYSTIPADPAGIDFVIGGTNARLTVGHEKVATCVVLHLHLVSLRFTVSATWCNKD